MATAAMFFQAPNVRLAAFVWNAEPTSPTGDQTPSSAPTLTAQNIAATDPDSE
jgi:hypothetical protein